MAEHDIRFADGAAYERNMGTWSRLAGEVFLDWLAPGPGLRWIDVGCGSGAFTELLIDRCAPAEVHGIDPSEGQLSFARARSAVRAAEFRHGDATALPFPDDRFDAVVMALVIFFVPDPAKGVAEMVRVAAPGGLVASYAWDMAGGGFPMGVIQAEIRTIGLNPPVAPSCGASRMETLQELWTTAGLQSVETREITVSRTFANFDDFWTTSLMGAAFAPIVTAMTRGDAEQLKARVRTHVPSDAAGRITHIARAKRNHGS
jgi:ubiquinone/menaquinone biosynthesis C-methylase UbiE